MTTTTVTTEALTTADRCDRCGAQAFVRVGLATGAELLFCGHHARQHESRLREVAVTWIDEIDRLND